MEERARRLEGLRDVLEDLLADDKTQKASKNAFLNFGQTTDFEALLDDESRKIKEQEAKDAELARKLMEEELERQEAA